MEGFSNFEQGILVACALASTLSLMWMAIIFSGFCLRSIDVSYSLRRIKEILAADANRRHQLAEGLPGSGDVIGRAIDVISAATFTLDPAKQPDQARVPVHFINKLAAALARMNTDGKLAAKHPELPNG